MAERLVDMLAVKLVLVQLWGQMLAWMSAKLLAEKLLAQLWGQMLA